MINILSYVGMSLQSEVCLWTLLGVLRTIFDATLFKVNANLKQVWQMTMPAELSLPVQRALRTMISGIMLVQCFTVYLYLAAYIVLLYPVFLEERPILVLPWLLLAAIRQLLCELTSLALGLGTCLLLGPARPPCIKFLIMKVSSITPAFYMWLLVLNYYQNLQLAAAFKRFPTLGQNADRDYGLELAVRRRRTKSLFGEEQLRNKLKATWYRERSATFTTTRPYQKYEQTIIKNNSETQEFQDPVNSNINSMPSISNKGSWSGSNNEYYLGNEVIIPRDADRILEQFVLMLMRCSIYLKTGETETQPECSDAQMGCDSTEVAVVSETTETPFHVGSQQETLAPYLRNYPQIFKKKPTEIPAMQSTPEVAKKKTEKKITKHESDNKITTGKYKMTTKTQTSLLEECSGNKNSNLSSYRKLEPKNAKTRISEPRNKVNKSVNINEFGSDEDLNRVIERMKKRVSANEKNLKTDHASTSINKEDTDARKTSILEQRSRKSQ